MQSHGGTMRALVISALVLIAASLWWGIYQQSEFNRVREMWRECAASYNDMQDELYLAKIQLADSTIDVTEPVPVSSWPKSGVYVGGADKDSIFHLMRMTRDGRVLCECSK